MPNKKIQTTQHTIIDSVLKGEIGIPRLMAIPSNIDPDTVVCENVWMSESKKVDRSILLKQWKDVYRVLSIDSPVFIMSDDPSTVVPSNDLVFAANSGLAVKGVDGVHKFIVSRFRAESRRTETPVIAEFVKNIYGEENVIIPPEMYKGEPLYFEGEADCKAIAFDSVNERASVYIVGVGVRTSENFCEWFEEEFGVEAIPYKAPDDIIKELYHLDCLVFPVDKYTVVMNTYGIDKQTIRQIEKYVEIIECNEEELDMLFNGLTNCIKGRHTILMPYAPYYEDDMNEEEAQQYQQAEFDKLEFMSGVCEDAGLQLITLDVSGGYPLGSQLSCFSCALVDQFHLYN
jgi:N-dimethylarginine dimethylaminohydrolase